MNHHKVMSHNSPAISDAMAMLNYPDVRNNERDELLAMVDIKTDDHVLDIQSAGGYLSDEIFRRYSGNVHCICLEPTPELQSRISKNHVLINNPVETFYDIDDGSVDVAVGLAGLHHSTSHIQTIKEAYRVLKPGGHFAVCDVIQGSRLSHWLNDFVHHNNPAGHIGNFIFPGEVSKLCKNAGFERIHEMEKEVPWVFQSRFDIAIFFKGLFGLNCTLDAINEVLDDYFTIYENEGVIEVGWTLIYSSGIKPLN